MVLSGLFRGFSILNGYSGAFSYWVFGRWGATNGCGQVAPALHEFDHLLHRLFVPLAARFFIFVHRVQFDFKAFETGKFQLIALQN